MSDQKIIPTGEDAVTLPLEQATETSSTTGDNGSANEIQWSEISRTILRKNQPINPLTTQPDEFSHQESYYFLNLSLTTPNTLELLFETHFSPRPPSPHRVAIIGASGTGKTLFSQKLAGWLSDHRHGVPLWIYAKDLGHLSLADYLDQKWLPQVANLTNIKLERLQGSLRKLIASGRLWLFLDAMDYLIHPEKSERFSALGRIVQDLQYWGQTVNIIVNCRRSTWQAALSEELYDRQREFTSYCTRELIYPREIEEFIEQWLLNNQVTAKNTTLSPDLIAVLAAVSVESLKTAIANPLRLSLLCRWWQQNPPIFPTTLRELYYILVQEYYQWKAEITPLSRQKIEKLNHWLSSVALQGLKTGKLIQNGEQSQNSSLEWGISLGWLTPLLEQNAYEFSDPTFAAYFAAQTISEGNFFLEACTEGNRSVFSEEELGSNLRFFTGKWQQVLSFWLSRPDLATEEKEGLINALCNFSDRCDPFNFYGKTAYFLAGAQIAHFPESQMTETLIDQLIEWAFVPSDEGNLLGQAAKETLEQSHREWVINRLIQSFLLDKDPTLTEEGWRWLGSKGTHHPTGITQLTELIENTDSMAFCVTAAECLGKIDHGNPIALSIFINLLKSTDEDLRTLALKGMAKIGYQQPLVITALVKYLSVLRESAQQRRVFQCLELIAPENDLAIAALVQIIRCSSDVNFQRMAAECLEKIDPGNSTAIAILVRLLSKGNTEEIRRMAVYSLGEVEQGNGVAIHGLVQLLNQTDDVLTRWVAISSLGKIGRNSPEAVHSLVKLIESSDSLLLQKEAVESLGKLVPTHPTVIATLVKWVQLGQEESLRREAAESLGKLDPGNPEAITALVNVLQTTDDWFTRRQAAESLGRIDSGNLEAINTLVQLIKTSGDEDIQSLAADSLGELGANNPAVIATLIRLLTATKNKDTLRRTIKSLSKVGRGNREILARMMELLTQSVEDESIQALRLDLAESVIKLLYPNQIRQIIPLLRDFFKDPHHQSDFPCQYLLWHCVQSLNYGEFYLAWHQQPLTSTILREVEKSSPDTNQKTWLTRLQEELKNKVSLSEKIRLVIIDSGEFLDMENPSVDIYDQMLAQGCSEFVHGIPETLSKLKLYWQLLERNDPQKPLILIFYGNLLDHFSLKPFWQLLSKFRHKVAIVGVSELDNLTHFSPDHPQLVEELLKWIELTVNS